MEGEAEGEQGQGQLHTGMHRVRLYKLNAQGLWDDKGTGHVAVEWLPVRLAGPPLRPASRRTTGLQSAVRAADTLRRQRRLPARPSRPCLASR